MPNTDLIAGRKKRLKYNTITSLLYQITAILCGFILPHAILVHYGSEVNGLVNSINQFLQLIALMDMGVGAVVQSALYKPLSENNEEEINKIISSANSFFNKVAGILIIYVIALVFFYPQIANQKFDFVYDAVLIIAISISTFSQYYIGVVDRLFLLADQRGYVQYVTQTVTLIFNTAICVLLINKGFSIQTVKLTTSVIYLIRPFILRVYATKHYRINRKVKYKDEPLKQKWNGIAQHIAAIILDETDVVVLTIFSTLKNVSIYSVYSLVVSGLRMLIISITSGVQALLGELWARKDISELHETFYWTEWVIHTISVLVFGCASSLMISFILLYTSGVNDTNYIQPFFSYIILLAYLCYCLRLPYNIMILAAGHYKGTQHIFIIGASINIILSVIAVRKFGLVGVAIGTFIAMLYQTIAMNEYTSKNLILGSNKSFIKHVLVDAIILFVGIFINSFIEVSAHSYIEWMLKGTLALADWTGITLVVNMIFYKSYIEKIKERAVVLISRH